MIRGVLLFICMFAFYEVSLASLSIQRDSSAEQKNSIADSKESTLYGSWLFNGGFVKHEFSGVNPEYRISQGDTLLVQLWGGLDFQAEIKVDAQGNIFVPKVGPIRVAGVKNDALNGVVLNSIKKVYKANVEAYISLASSQKVKVFLSGLVNKPGLYEGQSADSILRFIDLAGGIRRDIGSMRHIEVKRGASTKYSIDLYDFIQNGHMPAIQLHDGDVIFVGSRRGIVTIEGDVGFSGQYEIREEREALSSIMKAVVAAPKATHITLIEPLMNNGTKSIIARQFEIETVLGTLEEESQLLISSGSLVKVSSQVRTTSISVEVVGEHNSESEMVVPSGSTLSELLKRIKYTEISNKSAVQLYRASVARRQKDMLHASLSSLEQSVLTARSETNEAAQLRAAEAKTILQWIDRARSVEPKGQVLLSEGYDPSKVILQQGDRVAIPAIKNLVLIHGQVLFPTAIAFKEGLSIEEYINKAGGSNTDLDEMNILIMKPNGDFVDVNEHLDSVDAISAGDEIFVLAKPDVKSFQLTKDITKVLYQIAVSAAVVLAL